MFDEFFTRAHELTRKGVPFVTVTVVRADRPTSAKAGDKAIVTADGTMQGWIGGSCAQPTVIREALKALAEDENRLIRLSADAGQHIPQEGWVDLPMTCFSGGTLEIFIEPQPPRPRLLIVGVLPVARALAQLGQAMSYHVTMVDLDGGEIAPPFADEFLTSLNRVEEQIGPNTFVVVATHGFYDEPALEKILRANPVYVGLVASPKRRDAVISYLQEQGLSDTELFPLKGPAGLDIGARRGDEIALSIMAEIVQRRRVEHLPGLLTLDDENRPTRIQAIDPVCGMEVDTEAARFRYVHEEEEYFFCCEGCLARFARNPDEFLQKITPAGEARDPICLMSVDIASAKFMTEFDGDLYYFCCAGCKRTFDQKPESFLHTSSSSSSPRIQ